MTWSDPRFRKEFCGWWRTGWRGAGLGAEVRVMRGRHQAWRGGLGRGGHWLGVGGQMSGHLISLEHP